MYIEMKRERERERERETDRQTDRWTDRKEKDVYHYIKHKSLHC